MAPSTYIFIIRIGPVDMNKYSRFDEIPSKTPKDIKETKRHGPTDGQRENSIPTHKHSLRGYNDVKSKYHLCHFPLPGYYQYFWGVNVPCSRTQNGLTRVGLKGHKR